MKLVRTLIMFMLFALLVACSNASNQQAGDKAESEIDSQKQNQNSEQNQSEQDVQAALQGENSSVGSTAESSFLNESEQQIYDDLLEKLDKEKLVGLEPLSVAKLYVQASLDRQHDLEYFLYTTRDGHVHWSKEEHDQDVKQQGNDNSEETSEIKKRNFQNLEKGNFIKTSDYEGYIKYEKDNGDNAGFQMVKDEDSIWKVAFMPIQ